VTPRKKRTPQEAAGLPAHAEIAVHPDEIARLWKRIAWCGHRRPVAALREAEGMKLELTPLLLQTLHAVRADWQPFVDDDRFMGAAFALLLLARYREPRAFPLALQFLRFDTVTMGGLTDDMVGQSYPAVLASTFNGDFEALESLCEADDIPSESRCVGLRTMATLAALGSMKRADLSAYLARAVSRIPLTRSDFWDDFVDIVGDFHFIEHRERALSMCDVRIVHDARMRRDSILDDFSLEAQDPRQLEDRPGRPTYRLIDDVVDETDEWACFSDDR
jgi:hypothetical protein